MKMIQISQAARRQIQQRAQIVDRQDLALRIEIVGRSEDDFRYRLSFVPEEMRQAQDVAVELDGLELLADPISARYLEGARLDFEPQDGFSMDNPNPLWHEAQAAEVHQLIESTVNPAIAMHGGQVTLLDVQDGVAYLSMGGGCQGCGMASVTLRQGVEKMIREAVPAIREIVDTTDHASGTNPYFRPEAAAAQAEAGSPLG